MTTITLVGGPAAGQRMAVPDNRPHWRVPDPTPPLTLADDFEFCAPACTATEYTVYRQYPNLDGTIPALAPGLRWCEGFMPCADHMLRFMPFWDWVGAAAAAVVGSLGAGVVGPVMVWCAPTGVASTHDVMVRWVAEGS